MKKDQKNVYVVVESFKMNRTTHYFEVVSAYLDKDEADKEVEMHCEMQRKHLIKKGYDPEDNPCRFYWVAKPIKEMFDINEHLKKDRSENQYD